MSSKLSFLLSLKRRIGKQGRSSLSFEHIEGRHDDTNYEKDDAT
jgi:hypothetical protein